MTINILSSSCTNLDCPSTMEPSGLTIIRNAPDQDSLFMVSDNGGYGKRPLPYSSSDTWTTSSPTNLPDKSDDYECVTFAGNTQLVLFGIEGYRDLNNNGQLTRPRVRQYNSATSSFGSFLWTLNAPASGAAANNGMEALCYLPNGNVPSSWAVASTLLVLMAVQTTANTAYVYALPTNLGATPTVSKSHSVSLPAIAEAPSTLISDLFFDAAESILYVLYDQGTASYLQAVRWTVSGSSVLATSINVARMPWKGCEGVAVDGADLYFATDDGGANAGVYRVANFIPGFIA